MTTLKKWLDNQNIETFLKNNEATVNAIVSKARDLPYHNQVDAIHRIMKQMEDRKIQLQNEIDDINQALDDI